MTSSSLPLLLAAGCLVLVAHGAGTYLAMRQAWPGSQRWGQYAVPLRGSLAAFRRDTPVSSPRRLAIILAGPLFLYVAVAAVAFAHRATVGFPTGDAYWLVRDTPPGFDARGKLFPGDRLLSMDGQELSTPEKGDFGRTPGEIAHASGGRTMRVSVIRRGEQVTVEVTPRLDDASGRYRLGIILSTDKIRHKSLARSALHALVYPVAQTGLTLRAWFEGVARELRSQYRGITGHERGELSGPVGILVTPPDPDLDWATALDKIRRYMVALSLPLVLIGLVLAALCLLMRPRSRAQPASPGRAPDSDS